MKLVVGLGNIGDKYVFTRHNAGFMVVDKYALEHGLSFKQESKLKSFVAKHGDVIFAKPTTFMNLSGEAVRALTDYYKIDVEDVLIVFDDLNLDLGVMRFRANGSDGGHNGIKSVIKHLGTKDFARLKVGIGPQPGVNVTGCHPVDSGQSVRIPSESFVLQNFAKEQLPALKEVLKKSVDAIEFYLSNGMVEAQNTYN